MTYLAYIILGFAFLRLCVAAINYLSQPYLPIKTQMEAFPKVSILIPARDEEENIGNLLEGLRHFSYPELEILAYDDVSTDNTATIVQQHQAVDKRIKLLKGGSLPHGWLGKNHACFQLAGKAEGDYFLFLDADVKVKDGLVAKALSHMQKHQLKLLSIFPQQLMGSMAEKIAVPIMNWILLSLLPLPLVRRTAIPSLSAANGQFMLFEAKTYRQIKPHQLFKDERVEDIYISKYYKASGLKIDTLLGDSFIQCRMYNNLGSSIEGFTKNVFAFFGGSIMLALLFAFLSTAGVLLFIHGLVYGISFILMVTLIRVFISLSSKQNVISNVLLMPIQYIVFLMIMVKALLNLQQKKLIWKGRNILST